MLAGSSVNGTASDVRLPHYIYIFAEQGVLGVVGAGGEGRYSSVVFQMKAT